MNFKTFCWIFKREHAHELDSDTNLLDPSIQFEEYLVNKSNNWQSPWFWDYLGFDFVKAFKRKYSLTRTVFCFYFAIPFFSLIVSSDFPFMILKQNDFWSNKKRKNQMQKYSFQKSIILFEFKLFFYYFRFISYLFFSIYLFYVQQFVCLCELHSKETIRWNNFEKSIDYFSLFFIFCLPKTHLIF